MAALRVTPIQPAIPRVAPTTAVTAVLPICKEISVDDLQRRLDGLRG
ncbi:MAG: hypothetical protein WCC28_01140 [Mycobacterium sp.]